MLRKTLDEIVEDVRAEAGLSTNTSRGIDHGEHIRALIRRNHQTLARQYEWRHLRLKREQATVTMQAGSRYYDFPAQLDVQRIESVWFKWGNIWSPLEPQLPIDIYNALDSSQDQRADPVTHWDWYNDDGQLQFEVWPLPASDGGVVGFEGKKLVDPLTTGQSRADLDSDLLALAVAAELLGESEKEEAAKIKAGAFRDLRDQLLGGLTSRKRFVPGGVDPKMGSGYKGRQIRYIRSGG